jgi:hypothetical protein
MFFVSDTGEEGKIELYFKKKYFITIFIRKVHVKWLLGHRCIAHPQVADGGDSLQIWRVAAYILSKQSRTADRGWSSSFGFGGGLTTPHSKTPDLLRNFLKSLGPGRILWQNDLSNKKWI